MRIGRSLSYWTHTPLAFTTAANIIEYDIFRFILPENLLILTNVLLLFVRKVVMGLIKELIYAYFNSFGQNNRLGYGNYSYSCLSIDLMAYDVLDLLYWSVIFD
jgi:hypothetical protein